MAPLARERGMDGGSVMDEPKEVELKLDLPATEVGRIRRHVDHLDGLIEPPRTQALESTYFDTDRRHLRRNGISLRVRRCGERRIQTIKVSNGAAAGLFERGEWEREIEGDEPDLAAAHDTPLEPVLTDKVRAGLKPVFVTKVRRTIYKLGSRTWDVELTLDVGRVGSGRRSAPLAELELELTRGPSRHLFELARSLAKLVPVRLQIKSKAERGFDLVENTPVHATKADRLELPAGTPAADAFRRVGRACLHHLIGNAPAMRQNDPEGLHQMRVALRRFRAAISLFSPMVVDSQLASIKSGLRWMTGELAPARELDVFLAEVIEPERHRHSHDRQLADLSGAIAERRAAAMARAAEAERSPRFRALLLEAAAWLETGPWTEAKDKRARRHRERPVEALAARELSRRRKKIKTKGRAIEELKPRDRHKLRIRTKKIRYAAQFFSTLFPGKKTAKRRKRLASCLDRLQKALGNLNDIAVRQGLTVEMARAGPPGEPGRRRAMAAGRIAGREEMRVERLLAAAAHAHAEFSRIKPFWI